MRGGGCSDEALIYFTHYSLIQCSIIQIPTMLMRHTPPINDMPMCHTFVVCRLSNLVSVLPDEVTMAIGGELKT